MRLTIALGIIVVLAFPLQGCGKKGPLTLPASQATTPVSQTQEPQTTDASAPGQSKQP